RESLRVHVLDGRRLAAFLIDAEHRDVVRPVRRRAAIADVDELAIRVNVNGAGRLPGDLTAAIRKRALAEDRFGAQPVGCPSEHIERILRFERQIHPRAGRVKVEMPGAKPDSIPRRDRHLVRELAVAVAEYLERAWILFRR